MIRKHTPLLSLRDHPRALPELAALRAERRWRVQSGVVSKHHGFTTYNFPP